MESRSDELEPWYGANLETDKFEMSDNQSGKPIVMRMFDFKLPPGLEQLPHPEELIKAQKTTITTILWRDELVPIHSWKVVFAKDNLSFKIFVACQPKAGSTILEKPQFIQHASSGHSQ